MKWHYLPPLILQKIIWAPTRLLLISFCNIEIQGLENLKNITTNVIFAMNHSSEIDAFIVPASLPFWSTFSPIFYATKGKAFYDNVGWRKHLFGGSFINLWGGYTVYSGLKDYSKSLMDHVKIIKDGKSFCVFPEGGITDNGHIKPAHGGVAYLAESAQCPIIPVAVKGAYGTTVVDFFLFRKRLKVFFGKPIYFPELQSMMSSNFDQEAGNKYKVGAQYIMAKIDNMYKI